MSDERQGDSVSKEEIDFYMALLMNARRVYLEEYPRIPIVRFEALWPGGDVDRPQRKVLKVQPGTKTYVAFQNQKPRGLASGKYNVADLFVAAESQSGTQRGSARIGLCCTVEETSFTAPFVLPDYLLIDGNDPTKWRPDVAVRSLAIRSSDNLIGVVRFEMSLRCVAPIRLLQMVATRHLDEALRRHNDAVKDGDVENALYTEVTTRVQKEYSSNPFKRFAQKCWDAISGAETTTEAREYLVNVQSFSFQDIYPRLSLELGTVVRAAVRGHRAKDLYDATYIRETIESKIKDDMSATLSVYGFEVDRVSSFQFSSWQYESILQVRSKVAVRKELIDDVREEAAVNDAYRDVELEQHGKIEDARANKTVTSQDADARIGENKDQHLAEQERRKRNRDTDRKSWERDEGAKDGDHRRLQAKLDADAERETRRLDAIRQREDEEAQALLGLEMAERIRALKAAQRRDELAIEQEQKDAEQRRLLALKQTEFQQKMQAVDRIAQLPPDQQFQFLVYMDTNLSKAFEAIKAAEASADKLAMAQKFQDQIVAIYGQNSEQTKTILVEAARQLGAAVAARNRPEPPPRKLPSQDES